MTTLNYTQTRHIVLRLVEPGDTIEYHVTSVKRAIWKYHQVRGVLGGAEARALGELRQAGLITHQPRSGFYWPRPVELTDAGRALLAEWNTQHPANPTEE